jgi:hypothetical protein
VDIQKVDSRENSLSFSLSVLPRNFPAIQPTTEQIGGQTKHSEPVNWTSTFYSPSTNLRTRTQKSANQPDHGEQCAGGSESQQNGIRQTVSGRRAVSHASCLTQQKPLSICILNGIAFIPALRQGPVLVLEALGAVPRAAGGIAELPDSKPIIPHEFLPRLEICDTTLVRLAELGL